MVTQTQAKNCGLITHVEVPTMLLSTAKRAAREADPAKLNLKENQQAPKQKPWHHSSTKG